MNDTSKTTAERGPLMIDLALQGGGSHGAFTWGVLDRMLEVGWIDIEGISGTSAGAMNAAVLAHGIATGGKEGARAALRDFWRRVSRAATFSPFQRSPMDRLLGRWTLDYSPAYVTADLMARIVSPYALGMTDHNPLKTILDDMLDFEAIADGPVKLFITATNVRTGRGHVFRKHEITADVLLASACLPTLYRAVEICGEAYWDGGFAGNPTITPLVNECEARDVVLVQINPVDRPGLPTDARDIQSRINEVSFNATLLKELRMMAILRNVVDAGSGEGKLWSEMRMHRISTDLMVELGASSKLNAEWAFLDMLFEEGRRAVTAFGEKHRDDIGVNSTLDLEDYIAEC
ncbi:patatin-like phospholipase family protein [Pseudoruegeria sp. HB172150]|uniref:patatin-like phospholipase family protein n=1 Tax=Pseudoruegeria sp. HB172150 TaxID=2721164 RepID=UPI00352E6B37